MEKQEYEKRQPLIKTTCWAGIPLTLIVWVFVLWVHGWNWITNMVAFVLLYPLLCYSTVQLYVYEDCMILIRPLWPFRFKKIIPYDTINHIKESSVGCTSVNFELMDLLVYIKEKKRPIGIPMPSSKQREKFKELIASKGITAEWGLYE